MWKLAVLLFVAVFSTVSSQEPNVLTCQFLITFQEDYLCRVFNAEVLDRSQEVVFTGEHLANRTNDDVRVIEFRTSTVLFVIPQIFTTFPNLIELDIFNGGLESIEIPETVQLERLYLSYNNLGRIANGTFSAQRNIWLFVAVNSNITEIESGAFEGLSGLRELILIGNEFSDLGTALQPLSNLEYLDLERNNLTRIDENTFSGNPLLEVVYLEYNQINEVSPLFSVAFRDNLEFINFRGNLCVNRAFDTGDEFGLILLNNLLTTCFNNFVGEVPERRRITLEFQGPLSLFDEFGNIIARVN